MSSGPAGSRDSGLWFQDFHVGESFESGIREITDADLAAFTAVSGDANPIHVDLDHARAAGFDGPILQGPFGIALTLGLLHEMGVVRSTALALLDVDWRFLAPIVVGDSIRLEMTIVRCRRTSDPTRGVVDRHCRLVDQRGVVTQEGTTAMLVKARPEETDPADHAATDFGSRRWADLLVPALARRPDFAAATRDFDGSIELACGRASVQLRIYRGEVIEVALNTRLGPTFSLRGGERAWVELAFAARNDFVARTMRGEFSASGNLYEYVRLTKAVHALFDGMREIVAENR